jgi:hypothetical protein
MKLFKSTPILDVKESIDFIKKMELQENKKIKIIDLMIEKGLVKREGSRLINCCLFGEEVTIELQELEEELNMGVKTPRWKKTNRRKK